MVKYFRKNVSVSDLWVSYHDKVSDFYVSSWQRGDSAVPLLVVRVVLAVLALAILIWSVVEAPSPHWLIYLTNWGLVLLVFMTLSGVLVSSLAVCRKITEGETLPWYVSMYWFSYNVTISIALMITALYWILLFDPAGVMEDPRLFWLDVSTHGINSCIAVTELLACRTPVRALHWYQPQGLGLWYAAFSAIYYLADGTDALGNPFIYEVLDWRQRSRAGAIVAISSGALILIYLVVWGISLGRDKLSSSLFRTTSHDLPFTPPDNSQHTMIV